MWLAASGMHTCAARPVLLEAPGIQHTLGSTARALLIIVRQRSHRLAALIMLRLVLGRAPSSKRNDPLAPPRPVALHVGFEELVVSSRRAPAITCQGPPLLSPCCPSSWPQVHLLNGPAS